MWSRVRPASLKCSGAHSSRGRGRLPQWVVRIRVVLRFTNVGLSCCAIDTIIAYIRDATATRTVGWVQERHEMTEGSNVTAHIAYDDLREWLARAERLGEVRHIKGASWQEDMGL